MAAKIKSNACEYGDLNIYDGHNKNNIYINLEISDISIWWRGGLVVSVLDQPPRGRRFESRWLQAVV